MTQPHTHEEQPWIPRSPSDVWFAVMGVLLNLDPAANTTAPRGQETLEYPGPVTVKVWEPLALQIQAEGRAFRHVIGIVEGLSLVGQTSVPEVILDKVAAFRPFMRRSVFWGAYGPRVAGGVGQIVDLLKSDPDSRQAVLTLFDSSRDLGRTEQVDLPCTLSLQYQVRRGHLEAWTVMRSNDAWLGLPYDLMQFGMLQGAIAQALDLPPGILTHSVGSLHLYKRNIAKALEVTRPGKSMDFGPKLWGADNIDEISSRARRILLGQSEKLAALTPFEAWCVEELTKA